MTHGGFGTMAATLAHGVPLVMLPISADQPMNAQRAAADAASGSRWPRSTAPSATSGPPSAPCSPTPRYAIAATAAAAEAAAQPPLDHGLDLVEALVAAPALS